MITRDEILKGRDKEYPLSPENEARLTALLKAVNRLRAMYGKPMYISSGYRPAHYNTDVGGAPNSCHLTCQAVDFNDLGHEIYDFCTDSVLESCGLYKEDGSHTPTWCHVQTRATANRVFKP